jgi:hypothetical protein
MTYKGDPIAEKLDRLAEFTGVPRLQRKMQARDPMRFRVLPSVLLALAVAGLGVQIGRGGLAGFWIVWAGWMGSFMCQPFGPMGRPDGRKLDEREAAIVRQGHFTGMMWALGVATLGSLTITLFLPAVEMNVAVLAASAATPEPLEDDEE